MIARWKSKNIYDPSIKNVLYPVKIIKLLSPNIKNDSKGLHVFLMVVAIFTKIL